MSNIGCVPTLNSYTTFTIVKLAGPQISSPLAHRLQEVQVPPYIQHEIHVVNSLFLYISNVTHSIQTTKNEQLPSNSTSNAINGKECQAFIQLNVRPNSRGKKSSTPSLLILIKTLKWFASLNKKIQVS